MRTKRATTKFKKGDRVKLSKTRIAREKKYWRDDPWAAGRPNNHHLVGTVVDVRKNPCRVIVGFHKRVPTIYSPEELVHVQ